MSGVYYGKKYTNFKKEASILLDETELPKEFPLGGLIAISAIFVAASPKQTKRKHPRGDVDNYFKTLDVFNEYIWNDDDQIVWASMSKRYGEVPRIIVEVQEIDGIPEARTLSEMRF